MVMTETMPPIQQQLQVDAQGYVMGGVVIEGKGVVGTIMTMTKMMFPILQYLQLGVGNLLMKEIGTAILMTKMMPPIQ